MVHNVENNNLIKHPTVIPKYELNTLKKLKLDTEIIWIQMDKYNKLAISNIDDYKNKMV